jgi:predicted nucleotidyltransferase
MKAVGVIVEYNPFHNGHAFHLAEAKKTSGAEIAIAAMSGNFLQRGEPALVSKWTRTKMALAAGVDIVFEIPYQYATQQAEIFANGGVSLLSAAGCDSICFGSEDGNIEAFEETYSFMKKNDGFFQQKVNDHIQKGVSYPKALSLAFTDLFPEDTLVDLTKPNNILGFQYLKAAKKQNPMLNMFTVARKNAAYHDENFSSETIASATSIRKVLFSENQQFDQIQPYLPSSTLELLKEYQKKYGEFHHWDLYWPFLKFKLLQTSPEELRNINEIEEGIENRLLSQVIGADSFTDFMNRLKTKRYTRTRLQRVCLNLLTNAKKEEMAVIDDAVPYLRLLGMTDKGREYLNKQKQHFNIPLISKLSSYKGKEIQLDIRSANIYQYGLTKSKPELNHEYKETPILLTKKGTDQ